MYPSIHLSPNAVFSGGVVREREKEDEEENMHEKNKNREIRLAKIFHSHPRSFFHSFFICVFCMDK